MVIEIDGMMYTIVERGHAFMAFGITFSDQGHILGVSIATSYLRIEGAVTQFMAAFRTTRMWLGT